MSTQSCCFAYREWTTTTGIQTNEEAYTSQRVSRDKKEERLTSVCYSDKLLQYKSPVFILRMCSISTECNMFLSLLYIEKNNRNLLSFHPLKHTSRNLISSSLYLDRGHEAGSFLILSLFASDTEAVRSIT